MKAKIIKFLDMFNEFLEIIIYVTLGMSTAYMSITDIYFAIAMWIFIGMTGVAYIIASIIYKQIKTNPTSEATP